MQSSYSQYNECDRLREVIIGRYHEYDPESAYREVVNEEQKKGLPSLQELENEFELFRKTLESHNVQTYFPEYVGAFVYDQLTPRDIGITIGEYFVLSNMVNWSRRYEAAGIFPIINKKISGRRNLIIPPPDVLIEGGDIIVDKGHIYIGISQRTNQKAVSFLRQIFSGKFEVTGIQCTRLDENENVLHLDCTFNPVGSEHAIIYKEGFREIPASIRENYQWIEVDKKEQAALATNVLSLSRQVVISRDHPDCRRVNLELKKAGLNVIELPFDAAPSTGGSFRCCSLPLLRD